MSEINKKYSKILMRNLLHLENQQKLFQHNSIKIFSWQTVLMIDDNDDNDDDNEDDNDDVDNEYNNGNVMNTNDVLSAKNVTKVKKGFKRPTNIINNYPERDDLFIPKRNQIIPGASTYSNITKQGKIYASLAIVLRKE